MPQLVRLYIRNVIFGAGLSAVFVGLLLGFNVANLRHLILSSDIGYIALALLFVFNAVVFSGVQFGIAVMSMAEKEDPPGGGKRDAIPLGMARDMVAIPVPVDRNTRYKNVKKPY
ncbi:hypothetical protein C8J27_107133 [Rhodobacter aestuarii]|uniref:Uncharacterized protein n=1 Tax=Rhodobacter aestuarii TaxID=453582 RepID=A0A1N7NR52_9RHOB|nr:MULTISPECIES: hypothetical protein [Rhodobacter]PTV94602.1 hypothetical protein C8J27_107133 [Rhodobacter aestuarii]SIT00804.1 hypothetical protein SAMN05421580_10894 [Rhodobacter aestuarii]SOC12694.1 hypothetical protein SAMN05877809_106132 [Rhodobacter sp. JA431]